MALSRRVALAGAGLAVSVGALTALALVPMVARGASAATVAGGCRATPRIDAQWGTGSSGGEVVNVQVTNIAATTATTWSVTWTLPAAQRIVNAWNATVSTSGDTVTAINATWNGTLAPGASTNFGMQLAGTGPAPVLSCGNDAVPPSSAPPGPGDVNVTEADSRSTVNLGVGQTLGVSLPANYRPFTSPDPALSLVSTSGGYPSGLPLRELFRAVGTGSLDLSTTTDASCFHTSPPCGMPVHLWTVHVNIAHASTGGDVNVTEADNRTTVYMLVGQTLGVSLPADYRPFTSPDPALTLVSTSGGYPTGQPLKEVFRSVGSGSLNLSTETDMPCNHDPTPCPGPIKLWTVHVNMLYAPPTAAPSR